MSNSLHGVWQMVGNKNVGFLLHLSLYRKMKLFAPNISKCIKLCVYNIDITQMCPEKKKSIPQPFSEAKQITRQILIPKLDENMIIKEYFRQVCLIYIDIKPKAKILGDRIGKHIEE